MFEDFIKEFATRKGKKTSIPVNEIVYQGKFKYTKAV